MGPIDQPSVMMDNEGGTYVRNREVRRKRPPSDPSYTKSTHKMKKLRSKNAKKRQKRESARIREARKENYSEES